MCMIYELPAEISICHKNFQPVSQLGADKSRSSCLKMTRGISLQEATEINTYMNEICLKMLLTLDHFTPFFIDKLIDTKSASWKNPDFKTRPNKVKHDRAFAKAETRVCRCASCARHHGHGSRQFTPTPSNGDNTSLRYDAMLSPNTKCATVGHVGQTV